MERVMGIGPTSRPWEGRILPVNYTRESDERNISLAKLSFGSERNSLPVNYTRTSKWTQLSSSLLTLEPYHIVISPFQNSWGNFGLGTL